MSSNPRLGPRLLLRLLLLGSIVGFIAGWGLEWLLIEWNRPLPIMDGGPLFGVIIGLISGFGSYHIARRMLLRYVHSLHDQLGELNEIRPTLREDLSLDEEASVLRDQIKYEVSQLADDRATLQNLVEEARETLDGLSIPDPADFHGPRKQVDRRLDELEQLDGEIQSIREWFESTVRPYFRDDGVSLEIDELDTFDDMVSFQERLSNRLSDATETVQQLEAVIGPWKRGPEQLRSAIDEANDILVDAADLFREFPHEELPEQAEDLREATEGWDDMARRMEQGIQRLEQSVEGVEERLRELTDEADDRRSPEGVWRDVKNDFERADNRIDELKQAVDSEWLDRLSRQLENQESHVSWLVDVTGEVQQSLKEHQEEVETLNSFSERLRKIVGSTNDNENGQ